MFADMPAPTLYKRFLGMYVFRKVSNQRKLPLVLVKCYVVDAMLLCNNALS